MTLTRPQLSTPPVSGKDRRRAAVFAGVAIAHAGLFSLFALTHVTPPPLAPATIIDVELFSPVMPPPPPPPPPAPPAPVSGGGAPAAPSVIHTPPKPRPVPPEVPAPVVKAPAPALVIGMALIASPTPGMGQGGQGTGTGTGVGSGDGPGSGGTPYRFIEGPSSRQIADAAPVAARRARVDGMVNLRCVIGLDSRLQDCRVISETPAGFGFGEAAVRVAMARFRFSPPTRDGRPVAGTEMPLGIQFNLGGRRPPSGPLEG